MSVVRMCRKKFALLMLCSTPFLMGGCDCNSKPPAADAGAAKAQTRPSEKSKEPLIKKAELVDWCKEHGVPESICTRCNSDLIEGFKKRGDWCKEHDLPESQCIECHPDLKAKFEAMKPKD